MTLLRKKWRDNRPLLEREVGLKAPEGLSTVSKGSEDRLKDTEEEDNDHKKEMKITKKKRRRPQPPIR